MTNLALTLAEATAMYPERAAVRLDELVLTYQGLDERSARVAGLLAAHDVEPGDRVGLLLPNVPQFPMLYYGVLRAGAVVVPMNPLLKAREIAYYCSYRPRQTSAPAARQTSRTRYSSPRQRRSAQAVARRPMACSTSARRSALQRLNARRPPLRRSSVERFPERPPAEHGLWIRDLAFQHQ